MISISVCMIVKNEEEKLRICVESLKGIYDELIIVDTGSCDNTPAIADELGAKVYNYEWQDDFSAARNYAFSKAGCDYIYSADADELIDEENRKKFLVLKKAMDTDIDVVQMYYKGQLAFESVYNYDKELRPKLFKRNRSFIWEGAVHEQVRLSPVVYDSDIEIIHAPGEDHSERDLRYFRSSVERGDVLDARLRDLYARQLCKAGKKEDFILAKDYFACVAEDTALSGDEVKQAFYVLARAAKAEDDIHTFMKYALRDACSEPCSEMCYELGCHYSEKGDIKEAILWFHNAIYEAKPLLDLHRAGDTAYERLISCSRSVGEFEAADFYEKELENWKKEQSEINGVHI